MCFSSGGNQTPAPAPAEPDPVAEAPDIGKTRKDENEELYGDREPNLRVDRSASTGGVTSGGSGVRP